MDQGVMRPLTRDEQWVLNTLANMAKHNPGGIAKDLDASLARQTQKSVFDIHLILEELEKLMLIQVLDRRSGHWSAKPLTTK